jgi:hypothetical protein
LQYTSGTGFTCYANSATTTGTLAQFASTTSAQLAGVLSDETGSGAAVFGTNPAISGATITGSSYAGSVAATTLSASSTVSGTGFSTYLASPPAIGGTAPAAGTFTNLSSSGTVSGTGFSAYLASPPAIGTTTAAAGKFTTLQATSAITPAYPAGVVGNTTGSNVTAGSVGELISSNVLQASAVSFPNQTSTNVTSITLTPGDWDIWGQFITKPSSVTSIALISAWLSTTSATMPTDSDPAKPWFFMSTAFTASQGTAVQTGMGRINVSATTTLYLSGSVTFSGGTMAAYGNIQARRR